MSRTTIDIDDELIARVIARLRPGDEAAGSRHALRELVERRSPHRRALELEGTGWRGDLDEMRDLSEPAAPDRPLDG